MVDHANGECCADDTHGGDGIPPWSGIDFARFDAAMGLSADGHHDECEVRITGEHSANEECDCETREFSTSQCEGCGSWLAGDRHAFSLWRVRQRFPKRAVALP